MYGRPSVIRKKSRKVQIEHTKYLKGPCDRREGLGWQPRDDTQDREEKVSIFAGNPKSGRG